ncbi:cytochrome P450 [Glomus cerebriforme]|uniref:Cytochrome P450 n=1 Tax=Glomus cerebriforme TaxID=658196 RepID=A0A397TA62_9GLOM|nr:cytochrome P450 [Glomus cerebriforme]
MVPKGLKPLPSPPGARFYIGHYGLFVDKPQETLTKWAQELNSEIYSIKMGRLNVIILNTDKIVGELLQKRGAIYSSRLDSEYLSRYLFRGAEVGNCPYNDYYKKLRAITVGNYTPQQIEKHSSLIDKVTKEMLSEIIYVSTVSSNSSLSNPESIKPHPYIRRTTLNIILTVVAGVNTTSINDPLFKRLNKWVDGITDIFSPVNNKLDYFPILKYHPGNKMKKLLETKLILCLVNFWKILNREKIKIHAL